eukprot:5361_1
MKRMFLWFMVFIQVAMSSHSSSDEFVSSDELESDDIDDIIMGSFTTNLNGSDVIISICMKNDKYYLASRLQLTEDHRFINTVGRSSNIIESNGELTVEFGETYRFGSTEAVGIEEISLSLVYNYDSDTYTLSNGITSTLKKTSDKAKDCVAPERNWNDIDEPVLVESVVLNDGGTSWIEFARYESDNACWALSILADATIPESIPDFYQGGSLFIDVKFGWDGGLRMTGLGIEGTAGCMSGTQMEIWHKEDRVLTLWQCDLGVGATTSFTTAADCVLCDQLDEMECPLFVDTSGAKSILENNDNNNNGYEEVVININFSDRVIVSLWIIFIVFIFGMAVFCWCKNRKRT